MPKPQDIDSICRLAFAMGADQAAVLRNVTAPIIEYATADWQAKSLIMGDAGVLILIRFEESDGREFAQHFSSAHEAKKASYAVTAAHSETQHAEPTK